MISRNAIYNILRNKYSGKPTFAIVEETDGANYPVWFRPENGRYEETKVSLRVEDNTFNIEDYKEYKRAEIFAQRTGNENSDTYILETYPCEPFLPQTMKYVRFVSTNEIVDWILAKERRVK